MYQTHYDIIFNFYMLQALSFERSFVCAIDVNFFEKLSEET